MLERLGWAPFPFCHWSVSEILQILDAHLARPEAARCQIAETAEESGTMRKRRIDLRGIGKIIEDLSPLAIGAFNEWFIEPSVAQMIDKRQASAHRGLPQRLIDHHEINELGDAYVAGAAGPFGSGNDQIRQHVNGRIFAPREKFRLECSTALGRLTSCCLSLGLRRFRL